VLRVIYLYDRGDDRLSFTPGDPKDPPVFGALCNQVGARVYPDSIVLPAAGGEEGIGPSGFVVAARCRLFRLRVWLDRVWPHPPDNPHVFARARSGGRKRPRRQVAGMGHHRSASKPEGQGKSSDVAKGRGRDLPRGRGGCYS
jgi:hypothetical protein